MKAPKILITRLSHIGDCVLTLPLLKQVRQNFPDAYIVWAIETPSNQLLDGHPDLDELIIVPKDWLHRIEDIRNLRRQLSSFRFDISIDPQSMLKSSALAWLSGAKYRVGFRGQHSRELSQCFNNRRIRSEKSHLVDRSLDLIKSFGQKLRPADFHLPICGNAQDYIDQWVDQQAINHTAPDSNFYVINPGASWESKMWHNERFADAAREIHRQTGMIGVVSWAGDREREMAYEITEHSLGAAIQAPPTSLQQLAALLNRSQFYLGCDTGPMHIASAVGTRCVGLFGTTRPQDSGPYGRQHINIQRWFQSGTCRERRQAENEAMSDIMAHDVASACLKLIRQTTIKRRDAIAA